jgi:hypothetical protein
MNTLLTCATVTSTPCGDDAGPSSHSVQVRIDGKTVRGARTPKATSCPCWPRWPPLPVRPGTRWSPKPRTRESVVARHLLAGIATWLSEPCDWPDAPTPPKQPAGPAAT